MASPVQPLPRAHPMNSGDGSKPSDPGQQERSRPRLHIGGDASGIYNADRLSTVMVHADDPTPPPSSAQAPPRTAPAAYEALSADAPTPPPGADFIGGASAPGAVYQGTGRHQSVQRPYEPYGTGRQQVIHPPYGTGRHQPVHQPQPTGPQPVVPSRSTYNAEHITSTGFIPPTNFQPAPATQKKGGAAPRKNAHKKFQFNLSALTWFDDAGHSRRLQYAGGGFLAGAFAGLVLGIINAVLQGWEVVDGLGQLLFLAVFVGIVVAIVAAMRPERVDELLSRVSFFGERDNNKEQGSQDR